MDFVIEHLEKRRLLCGFNPNLEAHALAASADLAVAEVIAQTWMINFQNGSAATPAGYVADTGKTYGDRGGGHTFGWNVDNSSNARERNSSAAPDQRYDTLNHTQEYGTRSWELAIPNGQYQVRIVGGDPSFYGSAIRYNAEGVLVVSGNQTSSNKFVDGTKAITVSDGRLTITNASGSVNNKICFIEVTQISGGSTPTISLAATDSSAAEPGANTGTFKITRSGSTSASLSVGYTISGSAGNGTDYNTLSGSVTIAAGATSANITVTPKNDSIVESTESVTLTLKPISGYALGPSSASVTIADDESTGNDWGTGAAAPAARFEINNAVVNGKLYTLGGYDRYINAHVRSDVYDPVANTWKRIGDLPEALTHSGTAVDGTNIYLAGGFVGSFDDVATNHVWKFDTVSGNWSRMRDLPAARTAGGLVRVGRELHFFGGANSNLKTDFGTHWVLDLENSAAQWAAAPSLPNPRNHLGYIGLNGAIYAIGGQHLHNDRGDNQDDVHVYRNGAWAALASLPFGRSHIHTSTFIVNGMIGIAGGKANGGTVALTIADVIAYDPAQNRWINLPSLPAPRQAAAAQVIGSRLVVSGGSSEGINPQTTTWTIDTADLT